MGTCTSSLLPHRPQQSPPDCGNLPQSPISNVLSLTSPRDSKAFQSAADSDALWDRFLPPDLDDILSRAVHPVAASSKKNLYNTLCNSVLIRSADGAELVFSLEKSNGRKCYVMSARSLYIAHSADAQYWSWDSHPDSRFDKVARLLKVWWLEIRGEFDCSMLSPKTKYAAYLLYNLVSDEAMGLKFPSQEVSVRLGDCIFTSAVCVDIAEGEVASDVLRVSCGRADKWREIEMGEFFTEVVDERKVGMVFSQTITMNEKKGLIIEGIEIRPKT